MTFLPITQTDMQERNWEQLDFLFVTGDAYIDHPSFGAAIICRLLERQGYRVGVIAQPDWRSVDDFKRLGKPRLAVLVSAGNMDSMLNKYTAAKKVRNNDNFSPGGRAGLRPDRATIVYCNRIREVWKKIPIIIGGIEASLRRFAHYDYWSDAIRKSILLDCRADLLIYGMGEKQILAISEQLASGVSVSEIDHLPGTCCLKDSVEGYSNYVTLPSAEQVQNNKKLFAQAFALHYQEQDPIRGKVVVQQQGQQFLIQNPPAAPLSTGELDEIYALPYQRTYHPVYEKLGGVPAIQEVQFSLVSHRGCFGGCSFCAIVSHQGRIIQHRSSQSLIAEAQLLTTLPGFKGYIHDVGGPTANFRLPSCTAQLLRGTCKNRQCLFPHPCRNIKADHREYLNLLRSLRSLPGVKKVFVRSGLRYDYILADENSDFLTELCQHHISGQLKVAPEHVAAKVTRLMGKSGKSIYLKFVDLYKQINKRLGKEQYLVPYFMSSHPGSSLKEAVELAEFLRDTGYHPEQVQDFIPTPGSLSTCMYYSEINPLTGEKVYVAKDMLDKQMQRALLQYRNPKLYKLVYQALTKANRSDLIGFGAKCLIRPQTATNSKKISKSSSKPNKTKSAATKTNHLTETRKKRLTKTTCRREKA